jgi:hypothetical protein
MTAVINDDMSMRLRHLQSRNRCPLVAGLLICTTWAILGLFDTGLSGLIPGKSLVRYSLPVALCLLAFFSAVENRGRHYFSRLFGALAVGLFVGILSSAFGNSMPLGLIKLALYAGILFPLLYFGFSGLVFTEEGLHQKLLVCLGLLFIVIALYRGNTADALEVGNTNHVSALVLIAFPLIQLDQVGNKPILGRQALRFFLLLAVLAVIMNHSRGALAGVGVMIGAWIALRSGPSARRFVSLLVLGIALLILFASISTAFKEYLYKGDETLLDNDRQSEFELFYENFSQRPLLGYGFGLSSRVSPEDFSKVIDTWRLSWFVGEFGNSSLAILSGGGALLFAVFLYIFWQFCRGVWLALCIEFERAGRSQQYQKLVILFCATLGFLVHSQAEGWLMAPVTLAAYSFWFYVAAAIHISGEIFEHAEHWDGKTISVVEG